MANDCNRNKNFQAKLEIKHIVSKTDSNIIKILAICTPETKKTLDIYRLLKNKNDLSYAAYNTKSFIRGFAKVCNNSDITTINEYITPM